MGGEQRHERTKMAQGQVEQILESKPGSDPELSNESDDVMTQK